MTDNGRNERDRDPVGTATEIATRLVLVAVLVIWCFLIFRPFIVPVMWGVVLAVALHPLFERLRAMLGGRAKPAGAVFILVGLGALAVPSALISESFFDGLQWLKSGLDARTVQVPPPPAGVRDWPIVGDEIFGAWSAASQNLETALTQFGPQLKTFGAWLLSTLTGIAFGLLMTVFAIVVAGIMLMNAGSGERTARAVGTRLGGERGSATVDLAIRTIRSVASGVVGVAAVQATLAGIGLFAIGVPAAGLWAVLILVLAVAQLPPLLILGPAAIYVFATRDGTAGNILFAAWAGVVSISDSFLKPFFLGRGMEIPMPVILVGAIGGMLMSGILGLFVGAVVMAIGFTLATAWLASPRQA